MGSVNNMKIEIRKFEELKMTGKILGGAKALMGGGGGEEGG